MRPCSRQREAGIIALVERCYQSKTKLQPSAWYLDVPVLCTTQGIPQVCLAWQKTDRVLARCPVDSSDHFWPALTVSMVVSPFYVFIVALCDETSLMLSPVAWHLFAVVLVDLCTCVY